MGMGRDTLLECRGDLGRAVCLYRTYHHPLAGVFHGGDVRFVNVFHGLSHASCLYGASQLSGAEEPLPDRKPGCQLGKNDTGLLKGLGTAVCEEHLALGAILELMATLHHLAR